MIKIESPIRNEYYKKYTLRDDTNLKRSKSSSDINRALSAFNIDMDEVYSGTIFVPENYDPVLKCYRDIKGINHYYDGSCGMNINIKKYILQLNDSWIHTKLPSQMASNNPRALSVFYCKPLTDSGKASVVFHGGYGFSAGHSTWAIESSGTNDYGLGTSVFPDSTSDKNFIFQPYSCGSCTKSYAFENSMIDKWIHVFLMYDGRNMKLYLNNKKVWDHILDHDLATNASGDENMQFRFGQYSWVNTFFSYSTRVLPQHGMYAFPFWFKKPVSEEKVQQIYATGRRLIEEQGEVFYNLV